MNYYFRRIYFLTFIFLISKTASFTQEKLTNFCGTSLETQKLMLSQAELNQALPESHVIQNIPMKIHMVLSDKGNGAYSLVRLRESICTLNKDFEPTGFQFYMEDEINYIVSSKYDTANYDDGEEMMKKYNAPNVINVYIVTSPAGNCGYYTYRGDAVALSKSCIGKSSHTWAHEFGHYFSLPHTFVGWEGIQYDPKKATTQYVGEVRGLIENIDRSNCKNQADNFCDTPPDYISNRWTCTNDSSSLQQFDLNGNRFRSDGTLFMSYSNDNCMNRFSDEQMTDMHQNLNFRRQDLMRSITLKNMNEFDYQYFLPYDSSTQNTRVTFTWNPIEHSEYYLFQLSRTSTFSVILKSVQTIATSIEVDSLPLDKRLYWRVTPFNKQDFCTETSKTFTFSTSINSGIATNTTDQISLFPNPVSKDGFIRIQAQRPVQNESIRLFSFQGEELTTRIQYQRNSQIINIGKSNLIPGIYFLSINNRFHKLLIKD